MPMVKTSQKMSLKELYEAIKDEPFEAGEPRFFRKGGVFYDIIAFYPPVGMTSQIWIIGGKGKFDVMISSKVMAKGYKKAISDRFSGNDSYATENLKEKYGSRKKAADVFSLDAAATIEKLNL